MDRMSTAQPSHQDEAQVREASDAEKHPAGTPLLVWLGVVFFIYLLLLAVGMIADGFKRATGGEQAAGNLFAFASDPLMALLMGSLATALVQSSSTVTSVVVALVAAGMPVAIAVPIVMGANIGTTVTNTLVSMGHVSATQEFRRAFAAATIHDFFNILSVIIFLPLELAVHPLERMSAVLAGWFTFEGSASIGGINFVGAVTKPVVNLVGNHGLIAAVLPGTAGGIVLIVLGVALIFVAITRIGRLLKSVMTGPAKKLFHAAVGRGPITGIGAGTVITVLVQSSSTTTSLIVPFAGNGLMSLREVYPFTLGANIGTCITALLAATAITGDLAAAALQIALLHLLYNILGTVVIYGTPGLRSVPVFCAERLASVAAKWKFAALAYMLAVFFLIPGAFIGAQRLMSGPAEEPAREFAPGGPESLTDDSQRKARRLMDEAPDLAVE